jgi:hypothetical protein
MVEISEVVSAEPQHVPSRYDHIAQHCRIRHKEGTSDAPPFTSVLAAPVNDLAVKPWLWPRPTALQHRKDISYISVFHFICSYKLNISGRSTRAAIKGPGRASPARSPPTPSIDFVPGSSARLRSLPYGIHSSAPMQSAIESPDEAKRSNDAPQSLLLRKRRMDLTLVVRISTSPLQSI